jgi:hypothetical protein
MFFSRTFGLHSFATLPSSGSDSTRISYVFFFFLGGGGGTQTAVGCFLKN